MRGASTQKAIERLVDMALARFPEGPHREQVRDLSVTMAKGLAEAALKSDDLDDITLAKFLVRSGYSLGALHEADIDLLIRQDLAREAEARGE